MLDPQRKRDAADALLVLRAQLQEERAFTLLVHQHSGILRNYLARLVGQANADDVLQQTWIKAHRSLSHLAEPRAFKGWLFAIARREGFDLLRRLGKGEPADESGLEVLSLEGLSLEQQDPTTALCVQQGLARLSPKHQELLRLRYEYGLTYEELAGATGLNIGTVRSRLHNGKAKLRSLIEGEVQQ